LERKHGRKGQKRIHNQRQHGHNTPGLKRTKVGGNELGKGSREEVGGRTSNGGSPRAGMSLES